MRKKYLVSLLMMLLSAVGNAMAESYTVSFDDVVDTSDHAFKVASGWSHIVDGYEHPFWSSMNEYVSYQYVAAAGIDGSTALKIGSQYVYGSDRYDLLVTPAITGQASIYVKAVEGQTASLRFFKVQNGTRADEITPAEAPELTADGYVKVTLPALSGQQIGMRGEHVFIDNFEADGIELVLARGLKLVDAVLADDTQTEEVSNGFWSTTTYVLTTEDGDYTLSYDLTLQNTGDVTLNPGDEGYTVTLLDEDTPSKIYLEALAIGESIEPGQSKTINVKARLSTANTGSDYWLTLRENISATQSKYAGNHIQTKVGAIDNGGGDDDDDNNNPPVVEPEKNLALTIVSAQLKSTHTDEGGIAYIDADEQGRFTLAYDVTIKNTGDTTLEPGTEGYTLQLIDGEAWFGGEIGSPQAIDATLEPGEEATVSISVTASLNEHPDFMLIQILEGIGLTIFETQQYVQGREGFVEKRSLKIASVTLNTETRLEGWDYVTDADEQGRFTISADVELENTGNVKLLATDDDLTLSLVDHSADSLLVTTPVGQDIEPGQKATAHIEVTLNVADYSEQVYYYVRENVTATSEYLAAVIAQAQEQEEEPTDTVPGEVEPTGNPALTIVSAKLKSEASQQDGVYYIEANADGQFTIAYDVTIKNTGDTPLEPGREGYSLQFFDADSWFDGTLGEPIPIEVALQPGEQATVTAQITLDIELFEDWMLIEIIENITNTRYETWQFVAGKAATPSGINLATLRKNGNAAQGTFDVQGRRLSGNLRRSSLIIRNGKKIVVRNK